MLYFEELIGNEIEVGRSLGMILDFYELCKHEITRMIHTVAMARSDYGGGGAKGGT